jgi:hypothetical protein
MPGTKMQLKRYGDASAPYRYFEVIVDHFYLALGKGMLIELPYPYMIGMHMLDVWYNGQYVASGGGYEEVDEYHVLMDIRVPADNGSIVKLTQFNDGDEIIFRIWNQPPIYNNADDDVRKLGYILGEGNYDIVYDYDAGGDYVVTETITGDYNVTKQYTYTSFGKPATEVLSYSNRFITRTFYYDPSTNRLTRVTIRTQTN